MPETVTVRSSSGILDFILGAVAVLIFLWWRKKNSANANENGGNSASNPSCGCGATSATNPFAFDVNAQSVNDVSGNGISQSLEYVAPTLANTGSVGFGSSGINVGG